MSDGTERGMKALQLWERLNQRFEEAMKRRQQSIEAVHVLEANKKGQTK